MYLEQIRYFNEVVERNSINQAAEILHINQPSLSKAIKKLEEEFGIPLLIRTSKGVKPTPFGEEFLKISKEILNLVDESFFLAEKYRNYQSDQSLLNIFMDPYIKEIIFLKHVSKFVKFFPNLELNILEMDSKKIIAALIDGTVDIAIFSAFPNVLKQIEKYPNLYCKKISETEPYLIFNKNSSLAKKTKISIYEVQEFQEKRLIFSSLISIKTYSLHCEFSTGNLHLLLEMLENPELTAAIPKFALKYCLEKNNELRAIPITDIKNLYIIMALQKDIKDEFVVHELFKIMFPYEGN